MVIMPRTRVKEEYYVECQLCGKDYEVRVYPEDVRDWENGKLIQDAMPYLKPAERELIISRTCEECWDELFPE
jgi:hypothetical protein